MSRDEFEHYDLSEFTEEELVQFDRDVTNNLLQKPDDGPEILPISKASLTSLSGGGPTLDIAFESLTDAFPVEELPKPSRTSTYVSRKRQPKKGKNPYEQFCSWKKGFSVTDLVSPVWCEVQYEYGLYGERYKPLERRPSTFKSRDGKEIRVQQNVAQHNDITLKRGASIHKDLERELRPETVPVRITTNEERWALRLFNLTAGLEQLILDGRTRELPVFGVTHGHVVFGIIDEVTRRVPPEAHECHNPIKRNYVSPGMSPCKKKQRRSPFPSEHHIPTLDKSIPEEACIPEQLPSEKEVHNSSVTENSTRRPIHPQPTFYDLTIIDYKTRRAPSLPPEEDTVSSQLQLMLYHRLLSTLLLPETFDFDALWAKQGIDPHKSFSRSFVEDIGWPTEDLLEVHVDLCSMVAAWVSAVHSARSCGAPLRGISPELQIIYRKASVEKNPFYGRQKKPGSEYKAAENDLEALALREELDIARAIEESLFTLNQEPGDSTITQAVLDDVKNTPAPHSEEPALDEAVDLNSPPPDDPELKLAAQGSLPACTSNIPGFKAQVKEREGIRVADAPTNLEGSEDRMLPNRKDEPLDEDASGLSMILGTRKFFMDDNQLDAHLKDVLQWWFGIRPPRGVEVAQSGRCFTCEYRDGCEWREQKSQEARIALEKRRESN